MVLFVYIFDVRPLFGIARLRQWGQPVVQLIDFLGFELAAQPSCRLGYIGQDVVSVDDAVFPAGQADVF